MNIDKEIERLNGGIAKVNKMIADIREIGSRGIDEDGIYDTKKLFSLLAQKISIKDRMKLLERLRKV